LNFESGKMADTGEGKLQKMEVDYSSTVDEKLPLCEKMSKVRFKTLRIFQMKIMVGRLVLTRQMPTELCPRSASHDVMPCIMGCHGHGMGMDLLRNINCRMVHPY
jgi:hypothetical protein